MRHFYDLIAPVAVLVTVTFLPLGPLFFPRFYLLFLLTYFSLFFYASCTHFYKLFITTRNIKRNIRQWNEINRREGTANAATSATPASPTPTRVSFAYDDQQLESALKPFDENQYVHAFIIPNYSEPEALLRDTIKRLAAHRNAQSNYVIILAMEASEANHAPKAASLREQFKDAFLHFITTVHPVGLPGEARGKGSNVAYAARIGCNEIVARGVDKRRIVITVSDSDSAIPELYVFHVEKALNEAEDPANTLCAPPIFFARNAMEVPAVVRVTDIFWSIMVMQNLSNNLGMSFPCSTYSVPLTLAERVGYWDVDADAIGEDLHMWLKCFFKTSGIARSVPIYVPINLTNVQTPGFISNLYARYVQAKRHYSGVADLGYAFRHACENVVKGRKKEDESILPTQQGEVCPRYWLDKWMVCLRMLEAHIIPSTSGWLMFAAVPLTQLLLFPPDPLLAYISSPVNPTLTSAFFASVWQSVKIIGLVLPLPSIGMIILYERLHRAVERDLFQHSKQESRGIRNLIDYVWLPVSAMLFMTIPSSLAALGRLVKAETKYHVAEKVFNESD
ncbi:uncharacterized protein VTP21DRAFT_10217 [Calcarisporiella thermophila]|uniref:uncharacterized protein n=1 Tax=Calcarisporiella thermophila TaxID=911321 RepID=UPI0037439568